SRRKRLNLEQLHGTEAKRAAIYQSEEKTPTLPPPLVIGWAETPIENIDDDNADHSRLFDSPIKAPPTRRDPTVPSISKSTVADVSIMSNVTKRKSVNPLVTPAKTLRARAPPPMDEKTQVVDGGGGVGEKSTRKAKSTAVISRRGRGKENMERGRVFAFTSIDAEMKDRLVEAVRSLGGTVSLSDGFDPSTTHVVSGKMLRNEKLLGAMAAGIAILRTSYVMESEKEKKWIPEAKHEWCNNLQDLNAEKDMRMVESIIRWKREVNAQRSTLLVDGREGRVGAFSSWRVVLYSLTRSKIEPLARIIRIGGGEAAMREEVQRKDIETLQPTHVLVDGTMGETNWLWNLEELRFLHSLGARVFPIEFLFKFLTIENMNEQSHFHPEYKKIIACN
ncbi:hypothetical protein PMAYCL1PPCAC_23410, partial [Pristionchus mayeri]